jgi:restriction system protein
MSRPYRKSRRDPGLIEIAATSDWKVSAAMAAVCVLAATVIIPALLGSSRVLDSLALIFVPLAWLMAVVFGGISLIRLLRQRPQDSPVPPRSPTNRPAQAAARATEASLPEVDKAPLAESFAPPTSAAAPEARPTAWSRELIDRIEWKRFEDLCCEFYRVKGIRAETTRLGADGGVDIRLFQDAADPQRCTAVVQCKAWNQAVGVKPVRELRGVMAHERVDKAFFMAPNGFTDEARSLRRREPHHPARRQTVPRHARALARSPASTTARLRDGRRLDDAHLPVLRGEDGCARQHARAILGLCPFPEMPRDAADARISRLTATPEASLAHQARPDRLRGRLRQVKRLAAARPYVKLDIRPIM